MSKDLYSILGISRNATKDEIKKAYKKLALQYHPDRNNNDKSSEEKLKEINHAYSILKDDNKKAQYDTYGSTDAQSHSHGSGGFSDFGDIHDMFKGMFGFDNGGHGSRGSDQLDIGISVVITLEQAYQGDDKIISFSRNIECESCKGSGAASKFDLIQCYTCNGSGVETFSRGFFISQQTCRSCGGKGKKIKNPCAYCSGAGIIREDKKVKIKIPAGTISGKQLRITGSGNAYNGRYGNVYVEITVKNHHIFERRGNDLYTSCSIPMTVAALGGHISIRFLCDKIVDFHVPSGSQPGDTIAVKGYGMNTRSYLYVTLKVAIPKTLNAQQKDLLEQFKAIS